MRKYPFFIKMFITLALFIIIPTIVIAMISSYQIMRYTEDEISKSAIAKLKVTKSLNELVSDTLSRDALRLSLDGSVNDLNGVQKFDDVRRNPEQMLKLAKVQETFAELVRTNNIYHSVYLYIDEADYILASDQGVYYKQEFTDMGWLEHYRKYKETKSRLSWLPTRLVMASEGRVTVTDESEERNYVITYVYPLVPYTARINGAFVFNICEREFRKLIDSNDTFEEGTISIVNQQGDVISHPDYTMLGKNIGYEQYIKDIIGSDQKEGYLVYGTNTERKLITYYKSDFNDWIYIGFSNIDKLMVTVNNLRTRTLYISFICAVVGILFSYLISRILYNPVNKLLQDIKDRKGIDIKGNENEMAILSKVFDNLLRQEAKLFDIAGNEEGSIRDAYLLRLLRGECSGHFDKDLLGMDFSYPHFVCAVITIDKYCDFIKGISEEQKEYTKMLVLKVSEELLNQEFKCAGVIFEKQKVALIINLDYANPLETSRLLREAFVKVQEELSKVFDFTISVGIGCREEKITGLSRSLDEAQEALKYKLISGYGSIIFWEDIVVENSNYYYPFTYEKHIFNSLSAGIKDKLYQTIDELVDEIKERKDIRYDNVVHVFNQLIGTTVKYLLNTHCNTSDVFGNDYDLYRELSSKETLEDIRHWLKNLFGTMIDYNKRNRIENKSYFESAKDYILRNYKKDIDINAIAEHVGLSYSHLRKVFKDETGENIVNYINNLRIEESKRLLSQTNLTIKEIALNLGYNNDQSFTRFFKKYEGISPGEFRASNKVFEQLDS